MINSFNFETREDILKNVKNKLLPIHAACVMLRQLKSKRRMADENYSDIKFFMD